MKRLLLFLSMLLLVGSTTMAFANGANGSGLMSVSNNENGASTTDVVQSQNNNSSVKPLDATNNKPVITFTTSKEIGESIKLTDMLGRSLGYMEIEGAFREASYSDRYFLTAQTVKIIDYCTELNCSNNEITSIDCSNSRLERFDCSSNQLTSLILPNKPELKELNCSSSQLTSLDLSKNSRLESLDCRSNQLTSLDLSNNRFLKELECNSNQLTSLNLSNNSWLKKLHCYSNQLTVLDLPNNSRLSRLSRLDCSSNQLTSLDLSNNSWLTTLDCSKNQLTRIQLPEEARNLVSLNCQSNNIDLEHMEQLINSLPERTGYSENYSYNFHVQSSSTEGNQITQEQAKKAKDKGWSVLDVYKYTTPTGISTIDNADASPRKVYDLNGCEVNENQAKGVVIIKQGNKTYKKVVK